MLLSDLVLNLKQAKKNLPSYVGVLGAYDKNCYFLQDFKVFSFQNEFHGYFLLAKIPNHQSLNSLISELQHQSIIYKHYPNMMIISPQLSLIKRNTVLKIKPLELIYNEKYNALILN